MYQSVFGKSGYEWWVTNNWKAMFSKRDINANGDTTIGPTDLYLDRIFNMSQFNYNIVAGDMGGYMQIMSEQTHFGGFPFDYVDGENAIEVSPFDAEYTAKMLLPMIVRLGGGLFETFCRDVNCGGPTQP